MKQPLKALVISLAYMFMWAIVAKLTHLDFGVMLAGGALYMAVLAMVLQEDGHNG